MHHWKVLHDSQKQEVDAWLLFDHKLNTRVAALAVVVLFGKKDGGRTQNNFVDNPNLNMIAYDCFTVLYCTM